jgi:hypothetical protein
MSELNKVIPEKYNPKMENKPVKIYPTFRLGSDDLPDLKDMEVGKKYNLELEIEVMSKSQGSEWDQESSKKDVINSTLKVLKVGCCDDMGEKKEDKMSMMSGKEYEAEYSKRRSKANR